MELFYIYCAAIAGTLMAGQFLLSLVGLGGHGHFDGGTGFDHAGFDHGGFEHAGIDHTGGSEADHAAEGHGGSWFLGLLSFRAIVAAVAVFGLTGLAIPKLMTAPSTQSVFVIALGAGGLVMYGVAQLMQFVYRLKSDGTVQIQRSVGAPGSVYLRIPGHKSGAGKVCVNVQGRTMEYQAVTADDELATGSPVVVVDIAGPGTLEVARVPVTSTGGESHV